MSLTTGWDYPERDIHHCPTSPRPVDIDLQGWRFTTDWSHQSRLMLGLLDMSGWETTGQRGGPIAHENADGGFATRMDLDMRRITLEGSIKAGDARTFYEAKEAFGAILTSPRWDTMVVHEHLLCLSRQVEVCRTRPVEITPVTDKYALWSLELETASEQRVGTEVRTATVPVGGTRQVVNHGNHPADLQVSLQGGSPSPPIKLSIGGRTWVYGRRMTWQHELRVNMRKRTVRDVEANEQRRLAASGQWLTVPPGVSTVRLSAEAGEMLEARLSWRDTWS